MPSGDPHRTWFLEMIDLLRSDWRRSMSVVELIQLRDRLDGMLQTIRFERGIRTPKMRCSKCGTHDHASHPEVSVRAMILSLGRFGIASAEETRNLEKAWRRFRRDEQLDLYGQKVD